MTSEFIINRKITLPSLTDWISRVKIAFAANAAVMYFILYIIPEQPRKDQTKITARMTELHYVLFPLAI
jgi:hypothetical protein